MITSWPLAADRAADFCGGEGGRLDAETATDCADVCEADGACLGDLLRSSSPPGESWDPVVTPVAAAAPSGRAGKDDCLTISLRTVLVARITPCAGSMAAAATSFRTAASWLWLARSALLSLSFLAAVSRSVVATLSNGFEPPSCRTGADIASFPTVTVFAGPAPALENSVLGLFCSFSGCRASRGLMGAVAARIGGNNWPWTGTPPTPWPDMPGFVILGRPWFGNGTSLGWMNAVLEVICSFLRSSYRLGGYSFEAEVEMDLAVTICLGDGASGTLRSLALGFWSAKALVLAVTITVTVRGR